MANNGNLDHRSSALQPGTPPASSERRKVATQFTSPLANNSNRFPFQSPRTPTPGPQDFRVPPTLAPQDTKRMFGAEIVPENPASAQHPNSNGSFSVAPGPPQHLCMPPPPPKFTIPPPPPMFGSSPLRPPMPTPPRPAVPFSEVLFASPTKPLLPTSSLPRSSSNGTLQTQESFSDDNSGLVAASPYVLFTSHKVLKQKKASNMPSLGFGALVSPGNNTVPGPITVQHNPYRCHDCGAYVNLYCGIIPSSGEWKCVICKKLNSSGGEYRATSRDEIQNWPELSSAVVDFHEIGIRLPGFVPASDSRMSAPVILVIDESLDEAHLQHLQSSLHAFIDSLPPTMRIGIITYGHIVSVYDFSEPSIASADILPGDKSPSQETLRAMMCGAGMYLSPINECINVAHLIISSLRPYKGGQPEVGRDRCLGTATQVALAIVLGPTSERSHRPGGNSRIMICAGGPNTFGPGAVPHSLNHPNYAYLEKNAMKWMDQIGHEARQHEIVVDIFCAGTCPVRIPILQPLAKASGGVLLLHDDFGEAFGVNLQRAARRAAGSHGIFEIRCSDGIFVSHIIGPGEEAHADANNSFKNDNSTRVQMVCVEESQSFALSMEHKKDIVEKHVYFQFVARFTDVYQRKISRVITSRLLTTESLTTYLESVEEDVAAVLNGKRTVLQAKNASDALDMQHAIDERVKDIALKLGTQMPKTKLRYFPKQLSSLPEYLFHLRRGPLLGSIVGHEDERSVLRNLFLQASFDLSLRMLSPRVLMHREGGTFEEVPAYDIAMQSDMALVLDHGTDIFIWMGADLSSQDGKSASVLAACKTLAEELTENRFPAPRILSFKEGSSQARYLSSRLIPAHKDPPYEQEARFPQLRSLTNEQRIKLKSSFFIHVDDFSLCEWMRSLKLIPPEPR